MTLCCHNQADGVLLQNDLTSLQDWEDKWQMSFNAKKCQVIRITPKNRPPLPTTYKLHGHTLDTVDASKYLGVTISNNLTWDRHIDNTIGKGNKTLGFIRRNLKDCTKPVKSDFLALKLICHLSSQSCSDVKSFCNNTLSAWLLMVRKSRLSSA
jgi:hypothetical protein